MTRIIDYEGSNYRTDFWEGRGREYEDRVERDAIRRLLPSQGGKRLLELGAAYGRITNEYRGYQEIVLLDYSFSQLQEARKRYGDEGYIYVAADAYKLPFRAGTFDAATMIRVLHHFADVPKFFNGLEQVLAPDATFLLEFANKRNLKAVIRYLFGKQTWNPHTLDPVEFVELNFDFHPEYIAQTLKAAGFHTEKRIPVEFFRIGWLKRTVPASVLVSIDRLLQLTGLLYAPSVFTVNTLKTKGADHTSIARQDLFRCPETGADLHHDGQALVSADEQSRYEIRDGIYVFKSLDD